MILKRIVLPAIAVIVILVSMIVPASAAYVDADPSNTTNFYPIFNAYMDVYFDNRHLAVEIPDRFSSSYDSVTSTVDDITYAFSFDPHTSDYFNVIFSLPAQYEIDRYDFSFESLIWPCKSDTMAGIFTFRVFPGDSWHFSFDFIYVNSEGRPEKQEISFGGNATTEENIDPIKLSRVYDLVRSSGGMEGSYVIIRDFVFSCDTSRRSNISTNIKYPYYADQMPDFYDFLFNNHMVYEQQNLSFVNLSTFTDYLTTGVGSFLDTPFFGSISLGTIFSFIIGAFLIVVVIRIIK